jgi:hypothetical protein
MKAAKMVRYFSFWLLCALVTLVGCNASNNPAGWTQETIEQKLKSKYSFVELKLSPAGEGKYTGTAKSKEGETLAITISQNKEAKSLKYDFKGDRGWFEDGTYDLD